jgi:GGDEF domain-containing protein
MLLGNLTLVLLILAVGLSALASLKSLYALGSNLVQVDLPNIELAADLEEALLVRDQYEQRNTQIPDRAVEALADEQRERFTKTLTRFRAVPPQASRAMERVTASLDEYDNVAGQARAALERGEPEVARQVVEDVLPGPRHRLQRAIHGLGQALKLSQRDALQESQRLIGNALTMTLVTCAAGLVFGVSFALFFSRSLSRSLAQFKAATQLIGTGRYDDMLPLRTPDEIGDLAESFRWMSYRLKELEEMNLDANPLTRLPGNLAIEKALLERLQRRRPFAFCHVDLDNFKAFGDYYGYARGSEVLKMVGQALIRLSGGEMRDMFVGHIGGDDFVLICQPERVSGLCQQMIKEFDASIPAFYDPEDRDRGYIISRDRNEVVQQFPIMTVSIAVVTNERRDITSPLQVAEIAAQLKKYAKSFPKSIFVIDQRREV